MVSVGAWKQTNKQTNCFDWFQWEVSCFALVAGCPGSASKVLVALIIAIPGSASELPSGYKVALRGLLSYTGCGAGAHRGSPELGAAGPRRPALCIVYRAEVKIPAWTVLLSGASTSLT